MEDLSTEKASGTQDTTQNPQGGTPSNFTGGSSDVQPGTSVNDLEASAVDDKSVELETQQVPTIQIASVSEATTAPAGTAGSPSTGLAAISILLFITAVVLFVSTFKNSKNTTE